MIRLAVRCAPEHAERVLAELIVLAPGGVEEDEGDGYVEYAIYGARGEIPELGDLDAVAGNGRIKVTTEEIPDDWADRWRDFHRPIVVGERLVVRPSWEPHPATKPDTPGSEAEEMAGLVSVVIDPGQAFGTGAHPTTRMCLEILIELADEGEAEGALTDWGTGSAVLAIAAAKLGFDPVRGFDHEVAAIEAARQNAAANDVEIEFERRNLRIDPAPAAPTATANLTAPILTAIAERLEDVPDRLVCSGLLLREADGIAAAFTEHGLEEHRRIEDGDWAALRLERES
ncbi:MAG: 50S ribosomal protein L11 methyltransferase [Solirubrobacterales bacterium]